MFAPDNSVMSGWPASLNLAFDNKNGVTIPTRREHSGPLRILKGFSAPPGQPDLNEQLIVHPPGGIAAGDSLTINLDLHRGSQVRVTSPGAAKWYRSSLHGRPATQHVTASVDENACLEWLPLENIVFNGSVAHLDARFSLANSATLIAADIFCLGRPAAGESFASGQLKTRTIVERNGMPIFFEQASIDGTDPILASSAGLAGASAFGTLLAVPTADNTEPLESLCADLQASIADNKLPGLTGITAMPDLVVARWCGDNAFDGWQALRFVWQHLRQAITGSPAIPPRIWAC